MLKKDIDLKVRDALVKNELFQEHVHANQVKEELIEIKHQTNVKNVSTKCWIFKF